MLDFSLISHIDLLLFAAFTGAIIAGLIAAIARSRMSRRRPRDRFPFRNSR
jgi:hypothetical protein